MFITCMTMFHSCFWLVCFINSTTNFINSRCDFGCLSYHVKSYAHTFSFTVPLLYNLWQGTRTQYTLVIKINHSIYFFIVYCDVFTTNKLSFFTKQANNNPHWGTTPWWVNNHFCSTPQQIMILIPVCNETRNQ